MEVDLRKVRQPAHRRYAPKTRTGCVTCKIRRIKCDEAKPFCKRCTSTGRKCDGYATTTPSEICPISTEVVQTALTVDISCDPLERRTFDYFRSKTAPGISGYFRDAIWNRTVLQISHTEPAVRYAINALGALHEEILLRRKSKQLIGSNIAECRTKFPIKQYSKAINEMQKLLTSGNVSLEVILLCAIVFMHFEAISESFFPAMVHLENSIRLIQSQTEEKRQSIDPEVVQAISRIDVQATIYLGMRTPGLPRFAEGSETQLPTAFRDLTHARDFVNTSTCQVFHYTRSVTDSYKFRGPGDVPLEVIAKAQELEQTSLDLDRVLYKFMKDTTSRLTKREQHGLDMLRTRVKLNRIIAATCVYSEASALDAYLEVFEEVLLLCDYTMYNDDFEDWLFSVSLDEGLVSPLWFVASNCRDSKIRHRALKLMKKLPAKEGIWYLRAMTQIAEVCIRYEEAVCDKESPLCEDIPEWRRVHSSGLGGWDVASPKTTVTADLRIRPNGMDGEWFDIEEPIDFWSDAEDSDVGDFFSHNSPMITTNYPPATERQPTRSSYTNAEPWMARISHAKQAKPHHTKCLRSLGAFGLNFPGQPCPACLEVESRTISPGYA